MFQQSTKEYVYHCLRGGGEMGNLIREFNWHDTSIGDFSTWPSSLIATLSIIINSKFPMFLWWGPDLIQFYNDAYRPSLGNSGKHPTALGQKAVECWPEIWQVIKPLIDQVLEQGEPTWNEDQLIPIYRNGELEDVYWTFSYSRVNDGAGQPAGVLVICTETTKQVNALSQLSVSNNYQNDLNEQLGGVNAELARVNESLMYKNAALEKSETKLKNTIAELALSEVRFKEAMLRAPMAMAIFKGKDFVIELANNKVLELWGRTLEQVINLPLFVALPEAKGQGYESLLKHVLETGQAHVSHEVPVILERNHVLETTWINFICDPLTDENGQVDKIVVVSSEVTEQVNARYAIEQAEEKLRHAIASAGLGPWHYNVHDRKFIPSARFKEIFDFHEAETVDVDCLINQISDGYRDDVQALILATARAGTVFNVDFPITRNHDNEVRWIKATGKLYNEKGKEPKHYSGTVGDITDVKVREQLKDEALKQQLKKEKQQHIFEITLNTQEIERKRIAESLHNGIGQLLYAVKMKLGLLKTEDAEFSKNKQLTQQLLSEAIRETRRISHQLTPVLLEDFGLQAAINDICESFMHSIFIKTRFKGLESPVHKNLEISIYRIIQELVLNIVKHAKATQAAVSVKKTSKEISIKVSDNGSGFNYDDVKSKGIGLVGIFNKVGLLNGKFKIENVKGTRISITIPNKVNE